MQCGVHAGMALSVQIACLAHAKICVNSMAMEERKNSLYVAENSKHNNAMHYDD